MRECFRVERPERIYEDIATGVDIFIIFLVKLLFSYFLLSLYESNMYNKYEYMNERISEIEPPNH